MNEILRPEELKQAGASGLTCIGFKPVRSGSLRGFAVLHIAGWQVRIHGCAAHERDGKRWVQLPSRPVLDRDGNTVRGDDGKPTYAPMLEFDGDERRKHFSALGAGAIELYTPDAFDRREGAA